MSVNSICSTPIFYQDNQENYCFKLIELSNLVKEKKWEVPLQEVISLLPSLSKCPVWTNSALKILEEIIPLIDTDQTTSDKDPFYVIIAKIFLDREFWDKAKECLDKVQKIDVDKHYETLLVQYEKKSDCDALLECLKKMKSYPLSLSKIAEECLKKGFLDAAIEIAERATWGDKKKKHQFFGLLGCHLILTDLLNRPQSNIDTYFLNAKKLINDSFPDVKDQLFVRRSIIEHLWAFPNILTSNNILKISSRDAQDLASCLEDQINLIIYLFKNQ